MPRGRNLRTRRAGKVPIAAKRALVDIAPLRGRTDPSSARIDRSRTTTTPLCPRLLPHRGFLRTLADAHRPDTVASCALRFVSSRFDPLDTVFWMPDWPPAW